MVAEEAVYNKEWLMGTTEETPKPLTVFAEVASTLNDAGNKELAKRLVASVKQLYAATSEKEEQLRQLYIESDSKLLSAQRELREAAAKLAAANTHSSKMASVLEDIIKRAVEANDPSWDAEMLRRFLMDIAASAREGLYDDRPLE